METILSLVPMPFLDVAKNQLTLLLLEAKNPFWEKKATDNLAYLDREIKKSGKKQIIKEILETWSTEGLVARGFKVAGHGGDDHIYQTNELLREILPRGLVYINDELVIFANRKMFGLNNGDDDDSNMTTEIDPEAKYFIITTKANGENGQIAWYDKTKQWLIGSKNRKILVDSNTPLDQFSLDTYMFTVEIAKQWFKLLEKMDKGKIEELQKFMTISKFTLNFEIEQFTNQHVVKLFETRLVLIGATAIFCPCGIHPAITYALAQYLGCLSVVNDPMIKPMSEFSEACEMVIRKWDSEGGVIIVFNDHMEPLQMIKKKTWFYIILRAIREKIRNHAKSLAAMMCILETKKRLREIHKDFNIPISVITQFSNLAEGFISWVFSKLINDDSEKWSNMFYNQYPILWHTFLEENKLPLDQTLLNIKLPDFKFDIPDPALLIIFQGIPGLGKNYLAEQLKIFLQKDFRSSVIDQDSFQITHGPLKSGFACFEAVQRLVFGGDNDIVFLARNNANKKQYSRYLAFPKYIFIAPNEAISKPFELIALGISSILERQRDKKQNHPTDKLPSHELASLPFKFATDLSISPMAFRFDYLIPDAKLNNEQRSLFQLEFDRLKNVKDVHKADSMNQSVFDQIDKVTPLTWRRPIEELVLSIAQIIPKSVKGLVPLEMQYIAIQLTEESREILQPLISTLLSLKLSLKLGQIIADHVTLIHSNSYHDKPTEWEKALKLCGREVEMTAIRYKHQETKLTVMEILISDGYADIRSAIITGIPHLTLSLHGAKAKDASAVLQDPDVDWIDLPAKLNLKGIVKILP